MPGTGHERPRIVVLDDVDPRMVPPVLGPVDRSSEAPSLLDQAGRLDVHRVLSEYGSETQERRVVIITSRDLFKLGCGCLFGSSDRKRGTAVVSTYRLGSAARPDVVSARLGNLIAHEMAHLDGLRHCPVPGCLMHPARTPQDIGERQPRPCGRCPRGGLRTLWVSVGAAAACLFLFQGADRGAVLLKPDSNSPFSCAADPAGQAPSLRFRGEPLLVTPREGPRGPVPCSSASTAATLNHLFRELTPPALEVARSASGPVYVRSRGAILLTAPSGNAGESVAGRWADDLNRVLLGKGRGAESCAGCHLYRTNDVVQYAARSRRGT